MPNLIKDCRLKKIYDMTSHDIIADIGTDHGKLVGQLFLDGKIKKAYLTDISSKSLEKARQLMQKLNFLDKSVFVVCDGLDGLCDIQDNVQTIIAGMGGEEIIKILSKVKNKQKINSFILQPQKNVVNLREYLINNGYKIKKDIVVKDGKQFYFVIEAVFGEDTLTQPELFFGKTNIEQYPNDFKEYLASEKQLYDEILKSAKTLTQEKKLYYDVLCQCIKKGEDLC